MMKENGWLARFFSAAVVVGSFSFPAAAQEDGPDILFDDGLSVDIADLRLNLQTCPDIKPLPSLFSGAFKGISQDNLYLRRGVGVCTSSLKPDIRQYKSNTESNICIKGQKGVFFILDF